MLIFRFDPIFLWTQAEEKSSWGTFVLYLMNFIKFNKYMLILNIPATCHGTEDWSVNFCGKNSSLEYSTIEQVSLGAGYKKGQPRNLVCYTFKHGLCKHKAFSNIFGFFVWSNILELGLQIHIWPLCSRSLTATLQPFPSEKGMKSKFTTPVHSHVLTALEGAEKSVF